MLLLIPLTLAFKLFVWCSQLETGLLRYQLFHTNMYNVDSIKSIVIQSITRNNLPAHTAHPSYFWKDVETAAQHIQIMVPPWLTAPQLNETESAHRGFAAEHEAWQDIKNSSRRRTRVGSQIFEAVFSNQIWLGTKAMSKTLSGLVRSFPKFQTVAQTQGIRILTYWSVAILLDFLVQLGAVEDTAKWLRYIM